MTGHEQEYGGVGRDFRRARLASGQEVTGAAQVLRINSSHLTALEEGRYGELPAAVYVLGFVRAYAGYLQLDPDEMVRRVHQEHFAAAETEGLNFPAAPVELRAPSSGVMFYALLVAAVIIGAWYYLSGVNETPEQLIAHPPAESAGGPPPISAAPENRPALQDPSALSSSPPPEAELVPAAPLIPSVDELVNMDKTVEGAAHPPAPGADQQPQPEKDALLSEGEKREGQEAPGGAPADAAAPDRRQETTELPASPPLLTGPGGAAMTPSPSASPKPPVLLRASSDTWMQVIRSDGSEVKSWVMRAGEEYVPPGEAGLSLTIGNAGALSIFIDGAELAPLGEKGAVMRALPLDAASLRARFGP